MSENFKRTYRFAAGPAGQKNKGFEIGAGDRPLHISFSLQKADTESQNTGNVTIWNLNKEHLAVLSKKNCAVSLRAGYQDTLSLIFAGVVTFVSSGMDGADQRTEIEVSDGLIQTRDTYVSVSYKGKVSWQKIFNDVAKKMGVAVKYAKDLKFKKTSNGYKYVGPAKNILTKGCSCCGMSWSLQNGVLCIKKKNGTMSNQAYLLSKETGLIGHPTRVVVSQDEKTGKNKLGWDVTFFLNGAINIGDYVRLESKAATGYFKVDSIDISGDNVSGDWTCAARLTK